MPAARPHGWKVGGWVRAGRRGFCDLMDWRVSACPSPACNSPTLAGDSVRARESCLGSGFRALLTPTSSSKSLGRACASTPILSCLGPDSH